MKTVTIDIINDKVLHLLKDLEMLKLIRVRRDRKMQNQEHTDWSKYKGAMSKQSLDEIDQQLDELRNEWE